MLCISWDPGGTGTDFKQPFSTQGSMAFMAFMAYMACMAQPSWGFVSDLLSTYMLSSHRSMKAEIRTSSGFT
jgi:hypothetical protein